MHVFLTFSAANQLKEYGSLIKASLEALSVASGLSRSAVMAWPHWLSQNDWLISSTDTNSFLVSWVSGTSNCETCKHTVLVTAIRQSDRLYNANDKDALTWKPIISTIRRANMHWVPVHHTHVTKYSMKTAFRQRISMRDSKSTKKDMRPLVKEDLKEVKASSAKLLSYPENNTSE